MQTKHEIGASNYIYNSNKIILLHSHINYYPKYLIWCQGYNFIEFRDQLFNIQDNQNAP